MNRNKAIVAAVFLVLVLAVGVGVQTEAVRNDGFFHWLKRDETGMQMVTSPDGLDGEVAVSLEETYYDREKIPTWAKQWAESEQCVMDEESCEWQYICISEYPNRKMVSSYYLCGEEMVTLGMIDYEQGITMYTDFFTNYEYLKSIVIKQVELEVYQKEEKTGIIYYYLVFVDRKQIFYVGGCGNLQELEVIAEKYVQKIKN